MPQKNFNLYKQNINCMSISQNNTKKKEVQHSIQQNIAQIFICSCRKQYNSFPALYLHNKNKHDITLKIKEKDKMKIRVLWSGNKKKLIYEFAQESQSDNDTSQIPDESCNIKLRSKKYKKESKEDFQNQYKKLMQILTQFSNEISNTKETIFHQTNLKNICQQLTNYVLQTDITFQPTIQEMAKIKSLTKISILPHYFNGFVLDRLPHIPQNKIPVSTVLTFLAQLSDWLFEKKITIFLAVLEPVRT